MNLMQLWIPAAIVGAWLICILVVSAFRAAWLRRVPATSEDRRFSATRIEMLAFVGRWMAHICAAGALLYWVARILAARYQATSIENPRLVSQLISTAGRAVLAVVVAIAFLRVTRVAIERMVARLESRHIASPELRARTRTLGSVLSSVITTMVIVVAVLCIFPLAPLITSAGVVGLAIAFAAQTLLKDYLNGFFILFDNQYGIGDDVKIGDKTGMVEQVSLRTTTLRDVTGAVHIIPNSEVKTVTNFNRGWAVVEVEIPALFDTYSRSLTALQDLAAEFAELPEYHDQILEKPVVLGANVGAVAAFKVRFKARPGVRQKLPNEFRQLVLRCHEKSK